MNLIRTFFTSTLSAYSTVLFSGRPYLGLAIFFSTLFNLDAAITGLLGILFSNATALLLGVYQERIKKGLYGFNGLLVGLSVSLYHSIDINLILLLFAAIVLLVFITLALEYILSYFYGLPVLSIPFVIVSIILYLAFYDYKNLNEKQAYLFPYDKFFPEIPFYILYYLKSLGGIFFQTSPWSGLFIAVILFISSRISFFLSVIGFAIGLLFHTALSGNTNDLSLGNIGFNYILTSIAVGGYFLIPNLSTFVLGGLAALVSVLVTSFTKIFLVQFNIPVFALPFTTVTLLFVYVSRLLKNEKFVLVDFHPGSPEKNLDYYKTRRKRFGSSGLLIRLPFTGRWKVTQGYDGKFTHKDSWKESLDFTAVDQSGNTKKGKGSTLNDYYTFGLTVLAPSSGRVVKVIHHLEDNPPGTVDTENNWGNLVLIEHTNFLYSQISHLQKNSISVKEGDIVSAGAKIGLAGNSGRSSEPHIHLHFQNNPEIGSPTVPVSFTHYQEETVPGLKIRFNSIPKEGETISNLLTDFNLRNFFTFPPGGLISVQLTNNHRKTVLENWKVHLDLLGNRYLEDDNNNRLYFFTSVDSFTCLDYIGKKHTGLFFFYLSTYRVPFIRNQSHWEDRISYKHFSTALARVIKDLVNPFSDTFGHTWTGKLIEKDSQLILNTLITGRSNASLYELELIPGTNAPGTIRIKDQEGREWTLKNK
ncbi:urea transporter [Leptospira ilyithenensis]|uniref:M23ase beta-sheet core domain-containing protein n=1 Tax=Leptospira ilyithenensis TaxID=2484901 RepID=A0A4R9LRL2_9LEPT|nr:urea transporter [Leptospira ilyithenensis]TGN10866.1 hypothetical protein EHS11_06690 [Leptospira ilyithenensis]